MILCIIYWAIFASSFVFPSFKKTPIYSISLTSIIVVQLGGVGKTVYKRWRKKHPTKKTIALNLLSDKPKPDSVWRSFDDRITKIYDTLGQVSCVSIKLNNRRCKMYMYHNGFLRSIRIEHRGFEEWFSWLNDIKCHFFEKKNTKCAQWKSWFANGEIQQNGWMNKEGDCITYPHMTDDKFVNSLIFKDGYALGPDMKYYPDEDEGYDAI